MILLCTAVAAGCGRSEGGAPAPQIAARVNADVITQQELAEARRHGESLERLIDQRLARQRALERGLDRAPQITRAMESARSEILAHAYRQLVAEAQPRPTPEQIRTYYAEQPALFAQRRIYVLEEVALAGARELGAALRERAAKGEPLEAIARWLESLEARFSVNRAMRAAEQLPLELVPKLHAMKEGEIYVIDDGAEGLVVVRIAAARPAPLDEAAATPLIEKFLLARGSSEALALEMKRLRQQARIEYAAGAK